jgi:hypothetical protein
LVEVARPGRGSCTARPRHPPATGSSSQGQANRLLSGVREVFNGLVGRLEVFIGFLNGC